MRKVSVVFFFLFLLLPLAAAGQVRVHSHKHTVGEEPWLVVQVADSLSGDRLPGAAVFLTAGKDTLKKAVTDLYGGLIFDSRELSSDLLLTTSFLGYRTRRDSLHVPSRSRTYVSIGMQEDPQQLNSIIVRGDAIAMVMHGDTTVFNKAAFSERKGDVLRDLLEKFPGVEISEEGVSFQGRKVDRILFNGQNLFGKDMKNAMDMVLSSEVKDVRVYDTEAPEADDVDDKKAREHVMDVRTWKPLEHVGQLSASTSGGPFFSLDRDGKRPVAGGVSVAGGSYVLGAKPRVSLMLGAMHNEHMTFDMPVISQQPSDVLSAELSVGKDVPKKVGWWHRLAYRREENKTASGQYDVFHASENWQQRRDTTLVDGVNRQETLQYMGTLLLFRGKNRLDMTSNIIGTRSLSRDRTRASSLTDGVLGRYDRAVGDTSRSFSAALRGEWVRRLEKKGRLFRVSGKAGFSFGDGLGAQVDTLPGTMSREWLSQTRYRRQLDNSLGFTFTEPVGENDRLSLNLASSYTDRLTRENSLNLFTGETDMNLSQDVTDRSVESQCALFWTHGRRNDGLFATLRLGIKDILSLRDERLGSVRDWSKNYIRPVLQADMSWTTDVRGVSFHYEESEHVPTARQLRNVLDHQSPLFLRAGNPDLALPVKRSANFLYSRAFPKRNLTLKVGAGGNLMSHTITSKTVYFPTARYLEAFDYEAAAGSCLVTPVNVSGGRDGNLTLGMEHYLTRIRTKYSVNLGAQFSRNPFYLADVLHVGANRSASVNFCAFPGGEKFSLALNAGLTAGRYLQDGVREYDSFSPAVAIGWTQHYGDHWRTRIDAAYTAMHTTRSGLGYASTRLGASISFLFGPDKRSAVSLWGCNLAGKADGWTTSVTENYLRLNYQDVFGPSVGFSFFYVFSRR